MVGWSNCREMGRIGAMKQSSFQSGLVKNSFYFAQELVSLSRACTLPSLASRNCLLPSVEALKVRTGQELDTIEVVYRVTDATVLPHVIGELHQLSGVHTVRGNIPDIDKKLSA